MSEYEPPYIIETDEPIQKNKFPIVAQLGVLAMILTVIFGSLVLQNSKKTQTVTLPPEADLSATINTEPVIPQKISDISLTAKSAYVWDIKSQRVLFAKNADSQMPLASITKLMTALLAYELIEQNERATISMSAIRQEGSSGLSAGEKFSVNQLSELALVSSSNDAAYALAASVGELLGDNDPAAQFISGMNIRAKELGLETLEFKSTTGLDISELEAGAVGSARDVSFLMEYIITNYPEILEPTQQPSTRVYNTSGAYHEAANTNEAVQNIPNMLGSKTGYTDLAGGNLTIAFDAGLDRPIIVTVLGSTRHDRFEDVLKLVKAVQESVGQIN